jgi:anti-anti-sigma factor
VADQPDRHWITVTDAGDGVLEVAGELDLAGAAVLRKALCNAAVVRALDLGAVTFIDAAGLRALDDADDVSLIELSPAVRRLFDIVGDANLLTIDS